MQALGDHFTHGIPPSCKQCRNSNYTVGLNTLTLITEPNKEEAHC
jgi:hypothetical protein